MTHVLHRLDFVTLIMIDANLSEHIFHEVYLYHRYCIVDLENYRVECLSVEGMLYMSHPTNTHARAHHIGNRCSLG